MKNNFILLSIFILSFSVLSLHLLALNFFLYWHIWWFDLLVHFLAGALVSIFFIWFFKNRIKNFIPKILFLSATITFLVGVFWETFEYFAGLTFSSSSYILDTISDIVFTFLGGLFISFYFLFDLMRNKENQNGKK